ncbi:MAG TPA: FMN-binding protein [Trebonia sp.]|jgi:uncharacterized protein with FMN-binding domain|nr:FMN-binding protein [Trebonia sp.]
MRRAILAVTATVAGLVALLSFKTHSSSERTVASPEPAASLPPGERAITGNVANTAYGPVQVQVVLATSKIVKVNLLEQPESTSRDLQIGQFAFPKLIGETLSAQSARIDSVSGATYTSGGYIKSLQSALDNGA